MLGKTFCRGNREHFTNQAKKKGLTGECNIGETRTGEIGELFKIFGKVPRLLVLIINSHWWTSKTAIDLQGCHT